jgi:hypothetical protein
MTVVVVPLAIPGCSLALVSRKVLNRIRGCTHRLVLNLCWQCSNRSLCCQEITIRHRVETIACVRCREHYAALIAYWSVYNLELSVVHNACKPLLSEALEWRKAIVGILQKE